MAAATNNFPFEHFEDYVLVAKVEGGLDEFESNGDEALFEDSATLSNSEADDVSYDNGDFALEDDSDHEAGEGEGYPALLAIEDGSPIITPSLSVTVIHNTLEKKAFDDHDLNGPTFKVFVAVIAEDYLYELLFHRIDIAVDELRLHGNPIAPHQQRAGLRVLALNRDRFGRAEITAVRHGVAQCYFDDFGCVREVDADDIYAMSDGFDKVRSRVIPVWIDGAVHRNHKTIIEVVAFDTEGIPIAKQVRPSTTAGLQESNVSPSNFFPE